MGDILQGPKPRNLVNFPRAKHIPLKIILIEPKIAVRPPGKNILLH